MPCIFFSNKIEILSKRLMANLFGLGGHPLQERLVIVPSEAAKQNLLLFLAKELGIAASLQVVLLPEALERLCWGMRLPSFLELSLEIQGALVELQDEEEMRSVFEYFEGKETRVAPFCDEVSLLFLKYGVYGSGFLKEWEKKRGWQQLLWKKVYRESVWKNSLKTPLISYPVHLFGFSFLPKLYVQFFQQLSSYYYLLSPTKHFWGDFCTSKERIRYGRAEEENPLLANMGKVGRSFFHSLEEIAPFEEEYEEKEALTLLETLKKDLLDLDLSKNLCRDRSIQLHAAPSKLREIEVLLDTLVSLGTKDVLVLALDIAAYAPYIHMVFGSKESCFDYTIEGLTLSSTSPLVQGLSHLLALQEERFDVLSMERLFTHPSFLKKWEISEVEAETLSSWLKKLSVYWGVDGAHRHELLGEKMLEESNRGTWESGFEKLLESLSSAEGDIPISFTESVLLGKWIALIRSLREDLSLFRQKTKQPLFTWLAFLQSLAQTYFVVTSEDESFLKNLRKLMLSTEHLKTAAFSSSVLHRVFASLASQKSGGFQTSCISSVRFASLSPNSIVPKECIWLLGMDEASFPRARRLDSLCEMTASGLADFCPSSAEEDRYLFLQQLLVASSYFIMSFERFSIDDGKEQASSLIVQELLSFLEKSYAIKPQEISYFHSPLPFDAVYFQEEAFPRSCSKLQFAAAQSYYGSQEKKKPLPFLSSFTFPFSFSSEDIIINIKSLKKLAKHPIRFYFNDVLGIYLKEEAKQDEEFFLSPLTKARLRRLSLTLPLPEFLEKMQADPKLPLGPFREVACREIEKEVAEFHAALHLLGVDPAALFCVELKRECKEPFCLSPTHFILPSITVPLTNGGVATLVGKLEDLSTQGLLFHGKDELKDLVAAWPLYLVFLNLPTFEKTIKKDLLLTKEGEKKTFSLKNPLKQLTAYLDYYLLCKNTPSPFMPEWSKAFLLSTELEVEKAMQASFAPAKKFSDPYLQRLEGPLPCNEEWFSYARVLFEPLLEVIV